MMQHALLHKGGINQGSPVCGPFTLLCRAHHKRCQENDFRGDTSFNFVSAGNRQMSIYAMMMLVSHLSNATVSLEQSVTSCMVKAPPMCTVLSLIKAARVCFSHLAFGGGSVKRFTFFSPAEHMIAKLVRRPQGTASVCTTDSLVVRNGAKFTGMPQKLKASQAYTALLGKAFAEAFQDLYSTA